MIALSQTLLASAFLVFCRVGACLGLAPGFSSPRIPMRARLFIALGLTLPLVSIVEPRVGALLKTARPDAIVAAAASEMAIGITLGLMSRFLMASLETMASVAAMSSNLASAFGPRPDEGDSLPELANFVVFCATFLLFATDTHLEILRALADSFRVVPVGAPLDGGLALSRLVATLTYGFALSLRIVAPFLIFGLTANLAFGLVNKIAPQIAIYFVSVPFVICGSLILLYLMIGPIFGVFQDGFAHWLARQ